MAFTVFYEPDSTVWPGKVPSSCFFFWKERMERVPTFCLSGNLPKDWFLSCLILVVTSKVQEPLGTKEAGSWWLCAQQKTYLPICSTAYRHQREPEARICRTSHNGDGYTQRRSSRENQRGTRSPYLGRQWKSVETKCFFKCSCTIQITLHTV